MVNNKDEPTKKVSAKFRQFSKQEELVFFDRGIPGCLAYVRLGKTDLNRIAEASESYRYNFSS